MSFTHFYEILLQHGFFHCIPGIMGLSMRTLKTQDWTEVSWRNNVCTAKFSVKARLEHCVVMEYTYFQ